MPLRKIVTEKNVIEALNALPPITTPVMDRFYPEKMRRPHPQAYIRIDEVASIVRAVPVVMRGGIPVDLGQGQGSKSIIEPQPVDVMDTVSGKDLNDIKQFDGRSQKLWLQDRMDFARRTIRATSEALCIQSLSGQIAFPLKTADGFDTYEIKFGDILKYDPDTKLSADGAGLEVLQAILRGMKREIRRNGGGAKIGFYAAGDVFDKIVGLLGGVASPKVKIEIGDDYVQVGSSRIELLDAEYWDPKEKVYKPALKDGTLKAVDKDGFAFRYLALDDVDAGLKPLPIFAKPIKQDLPSGWVINTMSKPLPLPNVKGICDATVL